MSAPGGNSASRRSAVDGRSTRWNEHRERRRAAMLDAAIDVIEEYGADISVQQIADRLNLPRPVVYRHFAGRADLDEQIRRRIVESLLDELMPALRADGTVRDAVHGAVGTYVEWVDRHPALHRFLDSIAPPGDSSQALAGARDRIGSRLADLFTSSLAWFGVDPASARPMAFGVVGLVDGVVNSWRADSATALTCEQIEGILTESVLALFEGNARSLGVPLARDTPVAVLLGRPESSAS